MNILRHPSNEVIFGFGGSGTTEVVSILHSSYGDELKSIGESISAGNRTRPMLLGFSDATVLQHYLGQRGVVDPIHYSMELYVMPHEKHFIPTLQEFLEKKSPISNCNP